MCPSIVCDIRAFRVIFNISDMFYFPRRDINSDSLNTTENGVKRWLHGSIGS